MKKRIFYRGIVIALCIFGNAIVAQTITQERRFVSSYEIAMSSVVDDAARLNVDQAFAMTKKRDIGTLSSRKKNLWMDEYFSKDSLLIKIVSQKYDNPNQYMRNQYLTVVKKKPGKWI